MAQQIIQQLTIHLKGGQTVNVQFNAEKAEALNPQIDSFLHFLGQKDKQDNNFLFQGARVVLVRLCEVAAAEVVSMIREDAEQAEAPAEAK
ncbi:MAG: hypothetical protein IJ164_05695 [Duodenibacillus sp.]|nr:hypothetical protein [Duodenibacillus sp.]